MNIQRKILGRIKNLECRLAENQNEISQCQKMRFDVFYNELSAQPKFHTGENRQDADEYDQHCDHLLVLDNGLYGSSQGSAIVGCCRLLQQKGAAKTGGFYSGSEFDLKPLLARHKNKNFLEFGRSCVAAPYRNKRTIELLWQGSWAYVRHHSVDVMFGCASFEGTDPEKLAQPLSFLYHHARAAGEWGISAGENQKVDMNRIRIQDLDAKSAMHKLPPLIKGYLRLGAFIGGEAVIDHQFGTVDVMILLPVANLNPRYVNYYGLNADRH